MNKHIKKKEKLNNLLLKENGIYIDSTIGMGGNT